MLNVNRVAADANHGTLFGALPLVMQVALAVVAPLSVAYFGVPEEGMEFLIVQADIAPAYPTGMSKSLFQDAIKKARTLMYAMLHSKLTSGHAWQHALLGVRKTTALMLQSAGYATDLLTDAGTTKAMLHRP